MYRPGKDLKFPENLHMQVVRWSALRIGRIYPQEIFIVIILLEADSTPGPQRGRKDYVNEKFQ
jgi:hypothetical protein